MKAISCLLLLFVYVGHQKTAGDVGKQDAVPDTAGNAIIGAEEAITSPIGVTTITTIGVIAQIITVYNVLSVRLLPQPTTVEDTLEIVKRLEVLALPNDGPQYKHVEDTILRALNDMLSIPTGEISDMQRVLLLEKARYIDSEVILLLEALLGRTVASVDLLKNIKEHLRVLLPSNVIIFISHVIYGLFSVRRHQNFSHSPAI